MHLYKVFVIIMVDMHVCHASGFVAMSQSRYSTILDHGVSMKMYPYEKIERVN